MKKYIVIASAVAGKGKKIFKARDIVSELDFPEGEAEKRVKDGFLKPAPVTEKTAEEIAAEQDADKKAKAKQLLEDEEAATALSLRAIAVDLPEDATLEEIEAAEMAAGKSKAGKKK